MNKMRDISNNRVSYVRGYGDRTMHVNIDLLLKFEMSKGNQFLKKKF